jgi:hypothetical protein
MWLEALALPYVGGVLNGDANTGVWNAGLGELPKAGEDELNPAGECALLKTEPEPDGELNPTGALNCGAPLAAYAAGPPAKIWRARSRLRSLSLRRSALAAAFASASPLVRCRG